MANKSVFASKTGRRVPPATSANRAGAPAYAYDDAHVLAQVAMTGSFGALTYTDPMEELEYVLMLAETVEPEFLAKTAVYARTVGKMKDMPAVLLAVLSRRDPVLFARAFRRVVDNGKMLRTFVQVMRSGRTGRSSLGSRPKACVANWLNEASDWALLNANVGADPSLRDVIRMVHPKPVSAEREAFFAWIAGRPCDASKLPEAVRDWMEFQRTGAGPLPGVPFQMLTQAPLTTAQWGKIAKRASWQMLRQNLNTFHRHGVFGQRNMVRRAAETLRDPDRIRKAGVLPYQLMAARAAVAPDMPREIVDALHDAMEIAVANVPAVEGRVAICPDVSGSMSCPVTGVRKGATTAMRFVDVAALFASAMLRRNPSARVLPFERGVVELTLEPRDTVLTNAGKLASVGGGGTNCAAPLERLNREGEAPDLVVFISDNQSWMGVSRGDQTPMMAAWAKLKRANPRARMVCVDIAPYGTTQAVEWPDVLNVGGFSDQVFDQIAAFAKGEMGPAHWVGQIERTEV